MTTSRSATIAHALPGRVRWDVPAIRNNATLCAALQRLLRLEGGITDAVASDNGDNGIFASIQGAEYADFFVGDLAVDDLDDVYDFIDDVGPWANEFPQGGVVASGNDAGGILANLVSGTGDATVVASGTTADDNGDDGIGFTRDASAGPGSALAYLFSTQTLGNGDNDLYGTASSDSGNAFIFGTNLVYSSYSFFAQSTSGSSDIDVNP